MSITEVYLREEHKNISVKITSPDKPDISDEVVFNWQNIINILSQILKVPSGLIMKINQDSMEVFVSSATINTPYDKGDKEVLKKGLYCETVIGKGKELLVKNALEDDSWKDNPDVELGMISYYGLPIFWPDEEIFGTICVLDNKENEFNEEYIQLIKELKVSIEKDLKFIIVNKLLEKNANIDMLTEIPNRRKCIEILENEINRSIRGEKSFSIALIDLDKFKEINDTYGHSAGDILLIRFSKLFTEKIRSIDAFCRWGGDEFVLICPSTNKDGIISIINKIKKVLKNDPDYFYNIDFSFGFSTYTANDDSYEDIISRADKKMYLSKKSKVSTR